MPEDYSRFYPPKTYTPAQLRRQRFLKMLNKRIGLETEVDLRFAMRKLSSPPHRGIRGWFTRCVYMLWDDAFPTGVKLYHPPWYHLIAGAAYIYLVEHGHLKGRK